MSVTDVFTVEPKFAPLKDALPPRVVELSDAVKEGEAAAAVPAIWLARSAVAAAGVVVVVCT